jgi:hypothetical protein
MPPKKRTQKSDNSIVEITAESMDTFVVPSTGRKPGKSKNKQIEEQLEVTRDTFNLEIKEEGQVNDEIEETNVNDTVEVTETETNVNDTETETNVNDTETETNVNDTETETNVNDTETETNVNDTVEVTETETNVNDTVKVTETETNVNDTVKVTETETNVNDTVKVVTETDIETNVKNDVIMIEMKSETNINDINGKQELTEPEIKKEQTAKIENNQTEQKEIKNLLGVIAALQSQVKTLTDAQKDSTKKDFATLGLKLPAPLKLHRQRKFTDTSPREQTDVESFNTRWPTVSPVQTEIPTASINVFETMNPISNGRQHVTRTFKDVYASDKPGANLFTESILKSDAAPKRFGTMPLTQTNVGLSTRGLLLQPTNKQFAIGGLM